MRIQVDYCTIVDVEDASDKNGGGQSQGDTANARRRLLCHIGLN